MKKLFNFLFTISVLFLVVITTIRFDILEVFIEDFAENKGVNYIVTEIKKNLSVLDEETKNLVVQKLEKNEEFKIISKKIYKNIMKDLTQDTVTSLEISNELNSLINSSVPYQYRQIADSLINKIDFNNIYEETLFSIKTKLNPTIIKSIKVYSIFTSDSVIALLGSIVIISMIIIILKNKTINDALNDIGMSLVIDSGIMIIFLFFLKKIEVVLSMVSTSKIDLSIFIFLTFSFLIIGFILKDIKIKKRI